MIIGVTGGYGSGKDEVAKILMKKNFYHISFSDILREMLKKDKKAVTRDNLIGLGNKLRFEKGADVLSKLAVKKLKDGENFVFTSIRNPAEVEFLCKREDFILVNVVCPDKTRLERIIKRSRGEDDPKTLRELREKEKKENSSDPAAQQLHKVAKMAKVVIKNNSSLEELERKASKLVDDYLFKLQDSRPSWHQYFMNIAEVIKSRATCLSAKKGTVIVKDKRIIATGYNGTAKGIKHCNDGSCQRCTARHKGELKSGEYHVPCICAHSEENAIVQAAFQGTSTNGATLYTTFTPCTNCAKLIINAGIKEVFAKTIYPDDVGTKLLKGAGIKFKVLK